MKCLQINFYKANDGLKIKSVIGYLVTSDRTGSENKNRFSGL